MYIIFWWIKYI